MFRGTTPPAGTPVLLPRDEAGIGARGLEGDFAFASRHGILLARRDRELPAGRITEGGVDPVLAGLDEVTRSVAGTQPGGGTRPVLCGTIPFDPDEPADLFLAERPVWAPRPAPTAPVITGRCG